MLAVVAIIFVVPWRNIQWGSVETMPGRTITVVGEAKEKLQSQVATYNAGVSVTKDNKEAAMKEVNEKVTALIESIKKFGIPSEDIKTQSINFFQNQEQYYEFGRQKSRPGQWVISNSIDIRLRDVDKASEMANLLAASGATTVYGPNFAMEETEIIEEALISNAVKNARDKAAKIALSSGRKLGKILSVAEGGVSTGGTIYGGGRGGMDLLVPVESGSNTVSKQVTVIFEMD